MATDYEMGTYSDGRWFALRTKARQEKCAAGMLQILGVPHFLPLKTEVRQWSDRKQAVAIPLFSGYLFVHIDLAKRSRFEVLNAPGVAGFVGNHLGPLAIPDQQIEDIRTVLLARVECAVLPLLNEGDHVRVIRGPLAGVEGRLVRGNSTSRLSLSIDMISKSLLINVLRHDVELLQHGGTARRLGQVPRTIPSAGAA